MTDLNQKPCMCAYVIVYLRCSLVKNILTLNYVSHYSVLQLLVLLSSKLDGL